VSGGAGMRIGKWGKFMKLDDFIGERNTNYISK
jgi:hypothetical protein